MGGPGSGNDWRFDAKYTTDDYLALDVRALARAGALRPGYRGGWKLAGIGETAAFVYLEAEHGGVTLRYRQRCGGSSKSEEYRVTVVRTRCHIGGSRSWFLCPVRGCARRVAILYGGGIFACRHCYNLAYASSREGVGHRASRRLRKIEARLRWMSWCTGSKPKWMRRKTFERLIARHRELDQKW
jgi:hypothetical protein